MSSASSVPPDPAFRDFILPVLKASDQGAGNAATPSRPVPGGPAPAAGGGPPGEGSPPANGRGRRGQLTGDDPGRPGKALARRVAALHWALLDSVTAEDIRAVAARLVEMARAGDVAAAKLLLAYALGVPPEAVNPDTPRAHFLEKLG